MAPMLDLFTAREGVISSKHASVPARSEESDEDSSG